MFGLDQGDHDRGSAQSITGGARRAAPRSDLIVTYGGPKHRVVMQCDAVCELADEYVLGSLERGLGQRVRAHLRDCVKCSAYAAHMVWVLGAVGEVHRGHPGWLAPAAFVTMDGAVGDHDPVGSPRGPRW